MSSNSATHEPPRTHTHMVWAEVKLRCGSSCQVADANLHAEVATAAASGLACCLSMAYLTHDGPVLPGDRYNVGVEMERLRADLVQAYSMHCIDLCLWLGSVISRGGLVESDDCPSSGPKGSCKTLLVIYACRHGLIPKYCTGTSVTIGARFRTTST